MRTVHTVSLLEVGGYDLFIHNYTVFLMGSKKHFSYFEPVDLAKLIGLDALSVLQSRFSKELKEIMGDCYEEINPKAFGHDKPLFPLEYGGRFLKYHASIGNQIALEIISGLALYGIETKVNEFLPPLKFIEENSVFNRAIEVYCRLNHNCSLHPDDLSARIYRIECRLKDGFTHDDKHDWESYENYYERKILEYIESELYAMAINTDGFKERQSIILDRLISRIIELIDVDNCYPQKAAQIAIEELRRWLITDKAIASHSNEKHHED